MADDLNLPTDDDILTAAQFKAMFDVTPPTQAAFSLINYEPAGPVCAAYIESAGPIDAIMGPGGSGKTVGSAFKGMEFTIARMPVCRDGRIRVKGTVVRDNYRSLYRSTLQSWFEFFPISRHPKFFGGQDRPAIHKLELATVREVDGVKREVLVDLQVDFFAIQDVNYELLFKSYETSWAWLTEADGVDHNAIPFFYSRTARFPSRRLLPAGVELPRVCFVDFNPPDPNHELLKACQRGSFKEKFDPKVDRKTINFFRQPSGLADNAENRKGKTKKAYQDEMDTMPADQARRMVEGRPGRVKDGMPVYDEEWDYDTFVAPQPLEILRDRPLHCGFDQHLSPAAIFFQESAEGQIRFIGECAPPHGTGADRFLEQLLPMMHGPFRGLPIGVFTCDPAGFHGVDKQNGDLAWAQIIGLGLGGITILPAPTNEWHARRGAIASIMRTSMRGGRVWPHMIVDPVACPILIEGFSSGFKYPKHLAIGYGETPLKNKWSHPCEGAQYGVLGLRGMAGVVATLAQGGRPGNVVPFRQAIVQSESFSAFG